MEYKRLTQKNERMLFLEDFAGEVRKEKTINGIKLTELYNRLAELEDKIENETLIELPCKIGDTIYETVEGLGIDVYKVNSIAFILPYKKGVMDCERIRDNAHWKFWLEDINKTWFATKAEARVKLKELQGE